MPHTHARSHSASTARDANALVSAQQQRQSTLFESIAKRAYEKYLARSCADGSDESDWLAAEQEILAEMRTLTH